MRQETINIYTFDELSNEAKQKAIANNQDINTDYKWFDCIYCEADEIGLKISSFDIYYKDIQGELEIDSIYTAEKIISNFGENSELYECAKNFIYDWETLVKKYSDGINTDKVSEGNEEAFDEEADKLERLFKKNILKQFLNFLTQDYEYLISDEAITETLIVNEYEFYGDGSRYYER